MLVVISVLTACRWFYRKTYVLCVKFVDIWSAGYDSVSHRMSEITTWETSAVV